MLTTNTTLETLKPFNFSEWGRVREPLICDTKEHLFKHFQESTWRLGAAEFVVLLSSYARSLRLVDARAKERPESAYGFSFEKFTHLEMSNLSMLLLILDASIRDDRTFMDYGLIGWEKLRKEATAFLLDQTFEVNRAAREITPE